MVYQISKKLVLTSGFLIVLIICNQHLFHNVLPSTYIYKTKLVAAGEWWRIITHLFVHVSWYHLFLDALAVVLLWNEIDLKSLIHKVLLALTCGATSLLGAVWFSPYISQSGYCGLSGAAHGLMFFLGLLWIDRSLNENVSHRLKLFGVGSGVLLLLLSGAKSVAEVVFGAVLFSEIHFGDIGLPIVESHLGGVVGGAVAYIVLRVTAKQKLDVGTRPIVIRRDSFSSIHY